jgi:hypothetical protein
MVAVRPLLWLALLWCLLGRVAHTAAAFLRVALCLVCAWALS